MIVYNIPPFLDLRNAALRGTRFEGSLGQDRFERLKTFVADICAPVKVNLHADISRIGKISLRMSLEALIKLQCQRCVDMMDFPLTREVIFRLVPADCPEDAGEEEIIVDNGEPIDMMTLIEDELIVCLPMIPKHADCVAPGYQTNEFKENPFAVLARLKEE